MTVGFNSPDFKKSRCGQCGTPLPPMNDYEAIEAELEYRTNFPGEWQMAHRVLICDTCYQKDIREDGQSTQTEA